MGGKIFLGPHLDPWPEVGGLGGNACSWLSHSMSVGAAGHIFSSGVAEISLHPHGEVRAEFVRCWMEVAEHPDL